VNYIIWSEEKKAMIILERPHYSDRYQALFFDKENVLFSMNWRIIANEYEGMGGLTDNYGSSLDIPEYMHYEILRVGDMPLENAVKMVFEVAFT
jgi:hypothetical protein